MENRYILIIFIYILRISKWKKNIVNTITLLKDKRYLTHCDESTSICEVKDILKDGKKDDFFKKGFQKLYAILKEFCHKPNFLVLLYSPRRRADVFLHDIGDRG